MAIERRKRAYVAATLLALLLVLLFATHWLEIFRCGQYVAGWLRGERSRVTTVHGYRVHYNVAGPVHGRAVVLVHGLGGRGEDWQPLEPYLVRAGCRLYMLDLPGYGRSARPTDFSYSMADQADVVAGFMDAVGLRRAAVGGWSMGGWVAQEVAIRHPERVERLMLLDSAGLREWPAFDVRLFAPHSEGELAGLMALLVPHPRVIPHWMARNILQMSETREWITRRAVTSMLTGRDVTDAALPQLAMPVLIVWGTEDRIFPLHQAERMHRLIAGSQLLEVPGCGHLAPKDCVNQIGPTMAEFARQ